MRTRGRCRCRPYRSWLSIILPPSEFWFTVANSAGKKRHCPVSEQTCRCVSCCNNFPLWISRRDIDHPRRRTIDSLRGLSFRLKWPATFLLSYLAVGNSFAIRGFRPIWQCHRSSPRSFIIPLATPILNLEIASSCFWRKIIRSWFHASATSCCRCFSSRFYTFLSRSSCRGKQLPFE